jgi:ABC-type antimicrobial peptide transport system permease subunit
MLKSYFLVGWRNIMHHKLYTAIHIIGLAVGICACMAIWAITHYELSFDRFHPDRERIYRVVTEMGRTSGVHAHWGDIAEPASPAIQKELTGLETVAQFHNINPMITIPGNRGQVTRIPKTEGHAYSDVVLAEPEYFDLFKYQWLAGDPATLKDPFHVVLTAGEAQRYFGHSDPVDVLGRTLIYDDSIRVTVTGLVKDLDQVTDFTFKDFISYATARTLLAQDLGLDSWSTGSSSSETFVKLAKGVSADRVNAELKAFTDRHREQIMGTDPGYLRYQLQPLSDLHYSVYYNKNYGSQADLKTLYRLMGVAVFILILASINFINFSTAQSLRRAREIGIRKVLGGRRAGLVAQLMIETSLLALGSLALSLILLKPLLSAFPDWVPAGLKINMLDPATIGFAMGVVVVAVLLSGLYPALFLSSFQPVQTLKGESGGSPRSWGNGLAKGLVVFQFTISAIFIISAIVVSDQMRYMLHKNMGYSLDAIVRLSAGYKDPADQKELLAERLRGLPGVVQVSRDASGPTLQGSNHTTIDYQHRVKTDVEVRAADTNYLSLYGLKLLAGRNYFPSDTLREILINATYAQMLGFRRPEEAIGQSLPVWGKNPMIVGVVADFNTRSAQYGIAPAMVLPVPDFERGFSVKLRMKDATAADVQRTIAAIGKEWKAIFPEEPFHFEWVDQFVAQLYDQERKTKALINLAMMVTIFVSGMGLFGLAALAAARRTKEIGIRKVLGAGVPGLVALITRDFVLLVGIALGIASPVAWYILHGWLQDYVYRVSIGWWVFALAGVLAIGVTILTVGFHAMRMAIVNPVKSLRNE